MSVTTRSPLSRLTRGIMRTFRTTRHRIAVAVGNEGLYGDEVVEKVYRLLTQNEVAKIFGSPQDEGQKGGFRSMIADDTWPGDCSDRSAYFRYGCFSIVPCAQGYIAIGLGKNAQPGYYVGRAYQNDVMILFLPSDVDVGNEPAMRKAIHSFMRGIFRDSPVIGMVDGGLRFGPQSYWVTSDTAPCCWLEKINIKEFAFYSLRGNGGANAREKETWKKELPAFLAEKIAPHLWSATTCRSPA